MRMSVSCAAIGSRAGFARRFRFACFAAGLFGPRAQSAEDSIAQFKAVAAALSAARLNGAETEAQQEKALVYLDSVAASVLNGSPTPDLETANQRLAGLTSHTPPVGENYRLLKLEGPRRICDGR